MYQYYILCHTPIKNTTRQQMSELKHCYVTLVSFPERFGHFFFFLQKGKVSFRIQKELCSEWKITTALNRKCWGRQEGFRGPEWENTGEKAAISSIWDLPYVQSFRPTSSVNQFFPSLETWSKDWAIMSCRTKVLLCLYPHGHTHGALDSWTA